GDVIGYTFIEAPDPWQPKRESITEDTSFFQEGIIKMETGLLSVKQMELMMSHLPLDITYIDENDVVRFFSHGKDPIFHRTKSVIGRSVQNCHPPKSAHIVDELLEDFKSGKK
ncbi:PAS domain-containing protein, partial [Pseudomonas sp. 2995-3]|uniref:PAS domain-containing protein n=1 Tax=Pseudomonas sp. 2995-3 TaxID=1712680 RepID=UPI0015ABAD1C